MSRKHSKGLSIKARKALRMIVKVITGLSGGIGFAFAFVASCWSIHEGIPKWLIIGAVIGLALAMFGLWLLTPPRKESK